MIPVSYCIAFPRKIKEVFSFLSRLFEENFQAAQGKDQQGGESGQHIGPEFPQGGQGFRTPAQIEDRAARRAQNGEAPEFPVGGAQEEHGGGDGQEKSVKEVQRGGDTGQAAAEGAEEVIDHPGGRAQQDGLPEQEELSGNDDAHIHPKRRLKNPPGSRRLSS